MNARAWFYGTSFHQSAADLPPKPKPATYDFPWGRRPICPQEHERNVDGCDVPTIQESSETCPRFYCESCCDDRCCHLCHAVDVEGDEPHCPACQRLTGEAS